MWSKRVLHLHSLNPTNGTSKEPGDLFVIHSIIKSAAISSNLIVKVRFTCNVERKALYNNII